MVPQTNLTIRRAMAGCAMLIALPLSFAQGPADPAYPAPDAQQAAPLLSPEQLENLVAPIALYPDPLLGQVLAASTYPLEIVEAQQWLRQNGNLRGAQLMDAARQQNWDPAVQALVAFPDAMQLLASDVRWTTDLGNAFLAQQADVMGAVQRMRERARSNGRLATTPQQVVTTDTQGGQGAIQIVPADPQVVYVPVYNPVYVWGPSAWGAYPDVWYPAGFGWGFGFGPGIYMNAFYPGWMGWGGWGWGCGWYGRGLFLNTAFFGRYGFNNWYHPGFAGGYGGRIAWAHSPVHRLGVPYANRAVASRFNSASYGRSGGYANRSQFAGGATTYGGRSGNGAAQAVAGGARAYGGRPGNGGTQAVGGGARAYAGRSGYGGAQAGSSAGWQRFAGGSQAPYAGRTGAGGFANGASRSYAAPAQSNRGYSSSQGYRAAQGNYSSSPSPSFSRSYSPGYSASPAYSAPRGGGFSAPSRSYSAPSRSSSAPQSYSGGGGRSSYSGGGGSSGGHSGGGGGGHHR